MRSLLLARCKSHHWYTQCLDQVELSEKLESMEEKLIALEESLENRPTVESLYMTKEEMTEILRTEVRKAPQFLRKDKVHRVATTMGEARHWETCCGWRFGKAKDVVLMMEEPTHGPWCTRVGCFPEKKAS